MTEQAYTCPMPRAQVIEQYFMEHRAKVLDVAAFLDRIERADPDGAGGEDFRLAALREAIKLLVDGKGRRTKRVLEIFSDPTMKPLASAAGMKGAAGAWPGGVPGKAGAAPLQTDF